MARAGEIVQPPWNGAIPAGGVAAIVRIPVPGYGRLAIELSPSSLTSRSTAALFFQDLSGRRVLRLDYSHSLRTRTIDYHWTRRGTFDSAGIADQTVAGARGAPLHQGTRVFKYSGRTLVIVGAAADFAAVVLASNSLRRSSEAIATWALAYAAAETTGPLGAFQAAPFGPPGIDRGGVVFAIGGGITGYAFGGNVNADIYDWANATFRPLPETATRGQAAGAR